MESQQRSVAPAAFTPPPIVWREATADDAPFLLELTDTTMREHISEAGGSVERLRAWLEERNAGMSWSIVMIDGTPVGAAACLRWPTIIHLHSIHVLPEYQDRGIGSAMLRRLAAWADTLKLPIGLEVLKTNDSARRLYERHGFALGKEDGANYHMIRWPAPRV